MDVGANLNQTGTPLKGMLAMSVLFAILSVVPPILAWDLIARGWASSSWPTVAGEVLESKVWTKPRQTADQEFLSVEYAYTVGQRTHEGGAVTVQGDYYGPRRDALAARFATGQEIEVFVNPNDPADAVLVPGLTPSARVAFLYFVCFLLASLFLGFIWWKVYRTKREIDAIHQEIL